jgi:Cu2+-exporting ATPase
MFAMILGYTVPDWALFIAPVLGTVMYAWGGWPFLTGAVSELRSRKPGMMLLIGLAITVAFFASWGATLGLLHHELEFWWELALLIVIMLLGHWIEMRSLAQTSSALDTSRRCSRMRQSASKGTRSSRSHPPTCRSGTWWWSAPAAASPPTGRSSTAAPTWTSPWSPVNPAPSPAALATPLPRAPSPQTPAFAWRSPPRG